MSSGHTSWARLLGADPVPGLLGCGQPAARWVARTAVLDQAPDHPDVVADHAAVLADSGTAALIGRLPDWTMDTRVSGHQDPRFAPNLLNLLADMGVTEADHPRIGTLMDQFLAHQDRDGRFLSFGSARAGQEPVWGALPCDTPRGNRGACQVRPRRRPPGAAGAAQIAAARDAPSQMLSAAAQATAHQATAPRGRLERSLIDLGARDAGLLRQGAGTASAPGRMPRQRRGARPKFGRKGLRTTTGKALGSPDYAHCSGHVHQTRTLHLHH